MRIDAYSQIQQMYNVSKPAAKTAKAPQGGSFMDKLNISSAGKDMQVAKNAVAEAKRLGIPVFGIVDTNSNPDLCDYVIPANDDAVRSVSLIMAVIADAIVESKGGAPVVAYTKDEGDEVTMKEVIKQTEKENAEKLAKIRAERAARQEAYEKEQAERAAARAAREGNNAEGEAKPARKPRKAAPKKEAKEEAAAEAPAESEENK